MVPSHLHLSKETLPFPHLAKRKLAACTEGWRQLARLPVRADGQWRSCPDTNVRYVVKPCFPSFPPIVGPLSSQPQARTVSVHSVTAGAGQPGRFPRCRSLRLPQRYRL